jgi:hypothetical protein
MGFCPGPGCPDAPSAKVVDNLSDFCVGAVEQHASKTDIRNSDPAMGTLDFRFPTNFELFAMAEFQDAIDFPEKPFIGATGLETADNLIAEFLAREPGANAVSIMNGLDRFFGRGTVLPDAKCAKCHDGPVLDRGDLVDPTSVSLIPNHFAVGTGSDGTNLTTNPLLVNRDTGCSNGMAATPGDPLAAEGAGGLREFNTMPLVGIANTAPFFHDGSVATMRDAIRHYNMPAFNTSPGGIAVGTISLNGTALAELEDFMNALTLPEPNAALLHGAAMGALGLLARRRRRSQR